VTGGSRRPHEETKAAGVIPRLTSA